MGTRGIVGVVSDNRLYGFYQHWDMYPSGWPKDLSEEAYDIALADEWDAIRDGWVNKAWVDHEDDGREPALLATVAHPDGLFYQGSDWSYGMRPRYRGGDGVGIEDVGLAETPRGQDENGTFTGIASEGWTSGTSIHSRPTWRQAAEMGTMAKHLFSRGGWEEYAVVVDFDNREMVVLSIYSDYSENSKDLGVLAVASIDRPDQLQYLWQRAEEVDKAHGDTYGDNEVYRKGPQGPETARTWNMTTVTEHLADGMWRRPEGFPPLENTPDEYLVGV